MRSSLKYPNSILRYCLSVCGIIMILIMSHRTSFAQSVPPKWINDGLTDLYYSYMEVTFGDGSTIEAARDIAAQAIIERRNLAVGTKVHVKNGTIVNGDQDLIVTVRILDEYSEELDNGKWRVYLLVQTLKHPQYSFENVSVTNKYPFSARAFIPGMSQLYKGQKAKGLLFIVGEAACVGGIVAAESVRSNYVNLINSTHNSQHRTTYITKANNASNIRNGFIAATAVLYVWNVIDAVVSDGAKHVETYALVPYATLEFNGLALCFNF